MTLAGRPARAAAVVLILLATSACSDNRIGTDDARRLIESSPRFTAPDVLTVRPQYCATVDAPVENVTATVGRLQALEGAGAIRITRRAAAPNECTTLPGPLRERLVIALGDASGSFHPRALDGGGWEFPLAQRQFVSIGEMTFNRDRDPDMARVSYQWAWRAELLGQLLQVSADPVNAQATLIRRDGTWSARDVGF